MRVGEGFEGRGVRSIAVLMYSTNLLTIIMLNTIYIN